nr:HEAT repeat domain-containing protein [uncultured Devosia sp.]
MPMNTSLKAILLLWFLAMAGPAAAEGSLSDLAERATDSSVDTNVFVQASNAEVLRLLQHEPTETDLAAIPRLIDAIHRLPTDRQGAVLKLLGHLLAGSESHRPAILDTAVAALRSTSGGVRSAALEVLGRSEDSAVVPHLLASLSDPEGDVRYQALYGLSFFVDEGEHNEIFEAIAPLVTDRNESVRLMASVIMRLRAQTEGQSR